MPLAQYDYCNFIKTASSNLIGWLSVISEYTWFYPSDFCLRHLVASKQDIFKCTWILCFVFETVIGLHHGNVRLPSKWVFLGQNKLHCELHLLLMIKSLALRVIISDYMVVIFENHFKCQFLYLRD